MSEDRELSLLEQLTRLTGQVAGQTLDVARSTAAFTAMFGENWLKSTLMKTFEPERLDAMADAGRLLRDARETAGLSLKELTEALGVKDTDLLEDIESGERIIPLELLFRCASLVARHDPIPFLVQFMRTYNPALGKTLDQWGVMTLPVQFERERRWINLYRQHDILRKLDDQEYDRMVNYVDSATDLVLDVMLREKQANLPTPVDQSTRKAPAKRKARKKAPARKAQAKKPAKPR